ncbi:MAG: hypothetical protein K6E21_05820 [Bacilli bacterium]|nr:hypothetical protein [Bacilli bacterium]
MNKFRRHFRIYFKNNHPAYTVDEEGNTFVFHRIAHSKTSGGKKNWKIKHNPIKGHNEALYIVKQEKRDLKGRFSFFELELKSGVDANNLLIKKAGGSQPIGTNNITTSVDDGKFETLTQKSHVSSESIKPKHKKKGKKNG